MCRGAEAEAAPLLFILGKTGQSFCGTIELGKECFCLALQNVIFNALKKGGFCGANREV